MLAKALEQPPEKFHGLADQEECYRRRYVDLMTNDASRARFFTRSRLIQEIRRYLWDRGFVEVETPILQNQAGGAAAKPFFSEAACRAVFGTWGFFRTMHGKTAPSC